MTEKHHDEHEEDIKITDKRRFNNEGNVRTGEEAEAARETQAEGEKKAAREAPGGERKRSETGPFPAIDFPTFILSLATSAQMQLGVVANPMTGKTEKDLGLAKQTIDIIEMLEEKTKGNLGAEEARLVEHVLYDLRMMYVELNKGGR